jgi:hypothetical protein
MDVPGSPLGADEATDGVIIETEAGSKEDSDYVITMRDGKDPNGPKLMFTPAEWEAFVLGVKDGEFDLD